MIEEAIKQLSSGKNLAAGCMKAVMEEIMSGKAETAQIIPFLSKLNQQGETAEELAAAVEVMREHAVKIQSKHKVILDTCGTGGDKKHTFNISTAVAFIAAAAGIAVAKHGNRSVSSKSGSADVLEALGVNINLPKEKVEKCLDEIGIAFLFAQNFHPAMKFAMPARKAIGEKTIFNFLGPLSNPANATHQLIGVYDAARANILANALARLEAKHALIVCGRDGLDEITTTAKTLIYEVRGGQLKAQYEISPEDFGIKKSKSGDLSGGTAQENAKILLGVLNGEHSACRDAVILNAAAAIYAADKVKSIHEGLSLAEDAIDSKAALKKLEQLKNFS
ncbi:MAG: anthranilate phosphoribosyltransferase [Candidatus Omnitrophica bacterium]|jgi:anthranilate phosphoribosyltransferase|nr:anthranilate phosphoribosyltransferase [Candidatus Omnitrophota bacterium]